MTLLHLRGFTEEDFARSHPGGSLGKRLLLTVESLMHHLPHIPIVKECATLKEALIEMTHKKLGMTTIVNQQNELIGIFTDGDIRRTLNQEVNIHTTLITQVMSEQPKTILPTHLAFDALSIMEQHKITSLVAINNQKEPIGVIHIHDILRAGVSA
jgi:arabinose-5-phosphate isomerase